MQHPRPRREVDGLSDRLDGGISQCSKPAATSSNASSSTCRNLPLAHRDCMSRKPSTTEPASGPKNRDPGFGGRDREAESRGIEAVRSR